MKNVFACVASRGRRSCLLFAFVGTLAAPAGIGAQSAPDPFAICHGRYGIACVAYATGRGEVDLRVAPSETAPTLQKVRFGMRIGLLEPFERQGWIKAQAVTDRGASSQPAWVRRTDVAIASDFERVVDCWPIAELTWTEEEAGDYARRTFRVSADRQGKVTVLVSAGIHNFSDMAIWYARGVFLISKRLDPAVGLSPTFALDYPRRRLQIDMDVLGELGNPPFRWATDESLRGCREVPTVDPKHPMLRQPSRR